MLQKLKEEIERVQTSQKKYQKEVDKLEFEGEENRKDLENSRNQINIEEKQKKTLLADSAKYREEVDEYQKLKHSKRDKLKQL